MIIYLDRTLLTHRNGLLMINKPLGLIINMIPSFQDPGTPVPFLIINKKVLGKQTYLVDDLPADHHRTTMRTVRIAGCITLPLVDLLAADCRRPSRQYVYRIETGVLDHIWLLEKPDLGTRNANAGIREKRLDQHIQQFGRHL